MTKIIEKNHFKSNELQYTKNILTQANTQQFCFYQQHFNQTSLMELSYELFQEIQILLYNFHPFKR